MAYQSNLLGDFWTSYRQRRATGGRPLTSGEMRGLLDPMMGLEFQRGEAAAERARQQENFNRQMSLQEQAVRNQNRAASIGGVAQLGGLLGQGYLGYKGLQLAGQQVASTSAFNQQLLGLLGGGGGAANAGIAGTTGAANLAGGMLPGSMAPGVVGGMSPALAAEGAAGAAAPSAAAGVAGAALPGIAGGVAGFGLSKLIGANEDISQGMTLAGAGAMAGFYVGWPIGAIVGGGLGVIASLFDDLF